MSPSSERPPLREICRQFPLAGEFEQGEPHGTGHINDTYAVSCRGASGRVRYILQRINPRVFRDIPALMENIQRVTEHAARRGAARPGEPRRQTLRVVPTVGGAAFLHDAAGQCWRCYDFVEGARTYDILQDPAQAREAAYAFGDFQGLLADLPAPRLHETIPHFHHTRRRYDALRAAAAADRHGRAAAARAELEFAAAREPVVDVLLDQQARGLLPERITHNDTKLNNVMLDDATGRAVCVIDLDTVMPGLALYDFGDMVRSATNSAAEDETDLGKVHMRMPVFAALVEGYLASARGFLNAAEVGHLAFSARLITFEIGVRFLTDFLEGDVYFKTKRPSHNLDRCRCQFALVRSIEEQTDAMRRLVDRHAT
ncbi:MAG: aminoglycoside phosphotransferase family protein [Opitutaceae bacterium]|nr:aminoglycoside phosphotransferase family protein [Opitutaceae bacterium]